jgi:uncharacterized protein YjbI with pentapeptide repeats
MRSVGVVVATALLALARVSNVDAFVSSASKPRSFHALASRVKEQDDGGTDFREKRVGQWALSALVAVSLLLHPSPSFADGSGRDFRLPPIDFADKNRCQFSSSAMGQANAARDKLYDLRQCSLPNSDASGYDLSGVIMSKTDVSNSKFAETYFSKGYLRDSNFDGSDFSNAIIDRANFGGSSLKGAIFTNAVLTGTSFENANIENADFTDAYLGDFDIRGLCKNPTLKGANPTTGADSRLSAGCKGK